MKSKRLSDRPRRSPSARGSLPRNYYRRRPAEVAAPKPKTAASSVFSRILKKLGESLTLLIILGLVIYSLIVRAQPKVEVNSQLYHPLATYSQSVASILHGFWYHNKITFSQAGLTTKLQHQYPEVVATNAHLPLIGQKPEIKIEVAIPSFKLLSRSQTYLIGQQGTAITNQADPAILNSLPAVTDRSGYQIEIGKPALDTSAVQFIETLLAELKTAKVAVKGLSLPRTAQQIDLSTKDKPYYTKFYLGGDVMVESGQFLAARQHFQKSGQQPRQYLDVRVAGKIFYR